jgi:hypothetical protein
MLDIFLRTLALLPVVLLCACSSVHYKISLRDGGEIITAGKPEFISKTGYYRYRSISGKDALVRADEVLRLEEQ